MIHYTIATRAQPYKKSAEGTTAAAWLAMPRYALDLVAQATRYADEEGSTDVLNRKKVQLYLESAILQPSYKVGMFFDQEWWLKGAVYPAPITSYEITNDVFARLQREGFPSAYLKSMATATHPRPLGTAYATEKALVQDVEKCLEKRLTYRQEQLLLAASRRNTIGPSVTDTPIRQVVYFGNNARSGNGGKPVYGILASYDDEQFTSFWEELEYPVDKTQKEPFAGNIQPLKGPRKATDAMVKMLRQQLAALHFGPGSDYSLVPMPP